MKKIAFIQISSKRTGGNIWVQDVLEAISSDKNFSVEVIDLEAKYFKKFKFLKAIEAAFNLFNLKGQNDLWIRNFYSVVFLNKKKQKGKNLALIFHIDFSGFPLFLRPFLIFFEKFIFYRQLRKADVIVVVSEYWEKYFLGKGYKNVYKIYGGFNLNKFDVSEKEVSDFKEKYKLKSKPIIYLGNCQKAKGVVDAYEALKDLNAYFITSGEREVKIPAINFDLSYREYLVLLKASSIILTMSKFKEGWCRVTHEAMLLKTPVIGSGKGGMRELLEGGQQIICEDFKDLKEKVEFLLKNPEKRAIIGRNGYDFAKNFTKERFEESWKKLINDIV